MNDTQISLGSFSIERLECRVEDGQLFATMQVGTIVGQGPLVEADRQIILRKDLMTPNGLRAEIRRALHDLVCHEVDEWLRVNGTLVHDPHPSGVYDLLVDEDGDVWEVRIIDRTACTAGLREWGLGDQPKRYQVRNLDTLKSAFTPYAGHF